MRKRIALAAASISVAAIIGTALFATQASAGTALSTRTYQNLDSTCTAVIQELVNYPLEDRYRVAVSCSHIDGTEKVRGTAAFPLRPDLHTEWFTETGKTYYSEWGTPIFGVTPDAKVEFAGR